MPITIYVTETHHIPGNGKLRRIVFTLGYPTAEAQICIDLEPPRAADTNEDLARELLRLSEALRLVSESPSTILRAGRPAT